MKHHLRPIAPRDGSPVYYIKIRGEAKPVHVTDTDSAWDGPAFAFYEETMFDPPVYVVHADTWEAAYDEYVDRHVDELTDPDLYDYDPETVDYTSDGRPVDTELVQSLGQVRLHLGRFPLSI